MTDEEFLKKCIETPFTQKINMPTIKPMPGIPCKLIKDENGHWSLKKKETIKE